MMSSGGVRSRRETRYSRALSCHKQTDRRSEFVLKQISAPEIENKQFVSIVFYAFSALTLLVGRQEGHLAACKN